MSDIAANMPTALPPQGSIDEVSIVLTPADSVGPTADARAEQGNQTTTTTSASDKTLDSPIAGTHSSVEVSVTSTPSPSTTLSVTTTSSTHSNTAKETIHTLGPEPAALAAVNHLTSASLPAGSASSLPSSTTATKPEVVDQPSDPEATLVPATDATTSSTLTTRASKPEIVQQVSHPDLVTRSPTNDVTAVSSLPVGDVNSVPPSTSASKPQAFDQTSDQEPVTNASCKAVIPVSDSPPTGVASSSFLKASPQQRIIDQTSDPDPATLASGSDATKVSKSPLADVASIPLSSSSQPEIIDVDAEPEVEEILSLLGSSLFAIVGNQSYEGTAHPGELVTLTRDRRNPHDSNAVRVDNLRHEKVGYIMKVHADALAPCMDSMGYHLKVDGIIDQLTEQATQNNLLPVMVKMYARNAPSRKHVINCAHGLQNFFRQRGTHFIRSASTMPPMPTSLLAAEVIDLTEPSPLETEVVDWQKQQKQLDDMFEKQLREQLANLPNLDMPKQFHKMELFDHQVTGIKWMVHRETGSIPVPFYEKVVEHGQHVWLSEITHSSQTEEPKQVRGGILADDMGLGKTIQGLGLILSNPPRGHVYSEGGNNGSTDAKMPAVRPQGPDASSHRLGAQVAQPPPSASFLQANNGNHHYCWAQQQQQPVVSTNGHHLNVQHPPLGGINLEMANTLMASGNHDAIAAYVANAYASVMNGPAASPSPICTLIVSPVSVMSNWVSQMDSHVKDGVLRYAIYHGTNRDAIRVQVQEHEIDVLVVSYHTLAADFTKAFPGECDKRGNSFGGKKRKYDSVVAESSLFDLYFHRVILDEAHLIRNMSTKMFKACKALRSDYRWCLTGTPLQNRPDDINSLFCFLGVEPLGEREVFRRAISQPILEGDETGLARLRAMMAHIALRRTKALVEELQLPEKEIHICKVNFPPNGYHKSIHDAMFASSRAAFQATLSAGGDAAILKNYMSVLETLLRIRQACCSGILVPKERRERADKVLNELENGDGKSLTPDEGQHLLEKLKGTFQSQVESEEDDVPECVVCLCEMEESSAVVLRTCAHVFCEACLARVTRMNSRSSCPLCRTDFIDSDMVKKSAAKKAVGKRSAKTSFLLSDADEAGPSPKILALLESINDMKNDEKGVIFSQFTKFLDAIEPYLVSNGHSFTRIDGSKSATDRIDAIRVFSAEDSGPRFILCSLHAAGTGINLTRGSHIYLMDTWWNMAVENQAFDRCHRIGQKRKVRVVRFVMSGTVEEKMVRLQEAKAAIGKGAMEKLNPDEVRKARIGDLKSLFDIGTREDPIEIE